MKQMIVLVAMIILGIAMFAMVVGFRTGAEEVTSSTSGLISAIAN